MLITTPLVLILLLPITGLKRAPSTLFPVLFKEPGPPSVSFICSPSPVRRPFFDPLLSSTLWRTSAPGLAPGPRCWLSLVRPRSLSPVLSSLLLTDGQTTFSLSDSGTPLSSVCVCVCARLYTRVYAPPTTPVSIEDYEVSFLRPQFRPCPPSISCPSGP